MPAQPPILTQMRTPATGRSALARISAYQRDLTISTPRPLLEVHNPGAAIPISGGLRSAEEYRLERHPAVRRLNHARGNRLRRTDLNR